MWVVSMDFSRKAAEQKTGTVGPFAVDANKCEKRKDVFKPYWSSSQRPTLLKTRLLVVQKIRGKLPGGFGTTKDEGEDEGGDERTFKPHLAYTQLANSGAPNKVTDRQSVSEI
jgi:hypothetical protein